LASLLQFYGGWGVSAILMVVIWFMARHIIRTNSERLRDQKTANEEMLQMVEKRIEADLKHAEAFKSLKDVVAKLIEKL
jgi:flagellar biosynthesis/type III secretory pathway M-ring protein FliF/YscJ